MKIEVLSKAELKRVLLDAATDAELDVLIGHLEDARADLVARQLIAPADQDDAVQALTVAVTIREFREERERRCERNAASTREARARRHA